MDTHDSHKTNLPARFSRPDLPAVAADRDLAVESPRSIISVRMVVRGLMRYWWQMLAMWLVASAAILSVVYMRVKPSYDASALLLAEPSEAPIYAPTNNSDGVFLETQVNLIRSPNVLSAAALDPRAAPWLSASVDPLLELQSSLDVSTRPGTFLIQISMRSLSPNQAADLVNAVVDAYIKSNTQRSGSADPGQAHEADPGRRGP